MRPTILHLLLTRREDKNVTHEYRIDLLRCEESGVFVATSEHIPGLVLEAKTIGGIIDALFDCAPRLIRKNCGRDPEGARFVIMPERSVPMHSSFKIDAQFAEAA